ncbi:MAG: tRNA pseudouridine(55) synthase TruB [Clostridia bacterium]|nr:tRNA pseudouridine(55) synthase TruB [Clostridia bacterium]
MVMDGFINVDKPKGMTSHDVVAIIRKQLPRKTKVGHTGTLDPDATGVLPICVGKATRLAEYITGLPKTYCGELTLGVVTDSWDATGEVLASCDASHITLADVEALLPKFIGEIEQIPPMLSAIKVNGQKLYQLARKGEEIVREPRKITIYGLDVVKSEFGIKNPKILFNIKCSKGTYIRSLFYDMGDALCVGGHMSALRRLAVGPFGIGSSNNLEDIKTKLIASETGCFLPMKMGVDHLPVLIIKNPDNYYYVMRGRAFKVDFPDTPI